MPGDISPTVSIVIPVYNGANYVRQAIDSALAQTYPHTEVIVVNDGSNDGGRTRDIALSYGSRIRYLEKPNGGVASALNLGIREMRGDFFSWLSHDDVYYQDKIARQLSCFYASQDDTILPFCNYHVIDCKSAITGTGQIHDFACGSSVVAVIGTYVNGCSMLIPKTAFGKAGVFNESLTNCQDNELWLRMVLSGYRLRYMPDVLMQSRSHDEQGSRTTSARQTEEARAFYRWAIRFVGADTRVESAPSLFRVLLMKRLPSQAVELFRMLSRDRSPYFAMSSMGRGVFGMVKTACVNRIDMVPGLRRFVKALRKRRFRNSSHYWEKRYRRGESSGAGSYGKFAEFKTEVLNRFIAAHDIRTVADFGCGDGNQLRDLTCRQYIGLDVSPAAVELCRKMYAHDSTKVFLVYDSDGALDRVRQYRPEVTMSLDVVYHLVEDAIFERYIANLFDLSSRYVIIYSSNFDRRYDSPTQVDRRFADYVAKNIRGWKLLEVIENPYKGPETQSDFYIYERSPDRGR